MPTDFYLQHIKTQLLNYETADTLVCLEESKTGFQTSSLVAKEQHSLRYR